MTDTLSTADYWNSPGCYRDDVFLGSESVNAYCAPVDADEQARHATVVKGKAHQCMECSKCFNSPYKLRRHQLSHTGERPFKCAVCDKAFRQMSHLKLHSQSHCRPKPVKNQKALFDHLEDPAQCNDDPRSPLQTYSAQLQLMTAVHSPMHAGPDVPQPVRLPNFPILLDNSPSKSLDQTYTEHPLNIDSLDGAIHTGENYVPSTLQEKAIFDYNGMPSLPQAMTQEPHNHKEQLPKIPHSKKLGSRTSETVPHKNLDVEKQTPPSKASKSSKPCKVVDAGQTERSSQKGTHECPTCLKRFSVPSKLNRHMLCHTGQRPFACHLCARSFRQQCHLNLHLRTRVCLKQTNKPVKKNEKNVSCGVSGDIRVVTAEPDVYETSSVEDCTPGVHNFSDLEMLGPHFPLIERDKGESSHSTDSVPHVRVRTPQSDQIPKIALRRPDLPQPPQVNTFRIVHECPVCLKCFTSPSKLKRHCLIHTGQRPFQCYLCHRAFRQLAHLKVHYRIHERSGRKTPSLQKKGVKAHPIRAPTPQPKTFTCNQCGWKFRHQTHLTVHIQNHKSAVTAKPVNDQIIMSEDPIPSSSEMHRRFESTTELLSDSDVLIKRDLNSTPTKTQWQPVSINTGGDQPNRHCCTICFKCFDSALALQRHSLSHSVLKPFKCMSCSRAFRQRAHLKLHKCRSTVGTQIMAQREDSNITCGAAFSGTVDDHVQSAIHCGPAKHATVVLNDHTIPMQIQTRGDQESRATSLGVSRGRRYTLGTSGASHGPVEGTTMLMPTKQKGYACSICHRCFSVPSKLARHLLIHMGIKPFTCDICGKNFRQACHLQTHLNIHRKRAVTATQSDGGQRVGLEGGDSESRHWSTPLKNNRQTVNKVTKQTAAQKNLLCKKVSEDQYPCPSKSDKASGRNFSRDTATQKTVSQGHRVASVQHHSEQTSCQSNEENAGIFTVRELSNYAPEFVSLRPPSNTAQHSDTNANACSPPNQIFIDRPLDDTTAQQDDPPYRTVPARNKSNKSAVAAQKKLVRKGPNRCEICHKKFSSPSKLARHFLIHMGLRPYKCQVCSKMFRQRCHLQTHLKIHSKTAREASTGKAENSPNTVEVDSTRQRPTLDSNCHQHDLRQELQYSSHEEQSSYKGYYENNQPFVSSVHQSEHAETETSYYGFTHTRDHKKEANHFMAQALTQSDENITTSQENTAKGFSIPLPDHAYNPHEVKHISYPQACTSYTAQSGMLVSNNKVEVDCTMQKRRDLSGDDGQSPSKRSHLSLSPGAAPAAHAPFKEEVFELQFEMEGVDSRLCEPPNDVLVCPECCQCFQTEQKLRLHRCIPRLSQTPADDGQTSAEDTQMHAEESQRPAEDSQRPSSGYQCAICYKTFQVPSKLKRHYVIHTGHRPFQCSICSKTFTQSAHLKTHSLIHSKEKRG